MTQAVSRILKYCIVALAVFAGLLILFVNKGLASIVEALFPGSLLWAHGVLLFAEGIGFLWFWRGVFGGHAHLMVVGDASPEGQALFARELARRLGRNPHILAANLAPEGPEDAERIAQGMALLRDKADAEIARCARRVFLATALSQNGRLDALIVFFSLCRLVWRVAALYNQRPHPREIFSLYWAVITATFLALSLEELDLTTEISVGFGQAFHAMAPAGLTASIPFAGRALQTFTSSTIDGAANCYLSLRAGIVARNAYAYAFTPEERPSRAAVYREAGAVLLSMSASLVDKLAAGLADALGDAVKGAQTKTMQAGKGFVQGLGKMGADIGNTAAKAVVGTGSGVVRAGVAVTGAAASAAATATNATRAAMAATVSAAVKPVAWVARRAKKKK